MANKTRGTNVRRSRATVSDSDPAILYQFRKGEEAAIIF